MDQNIKVIDDNGNVVMKFKGEIKEPSINSLDDFVCFLTNINYRLEKLEQRFDTLENETKGKRIAELIIKEINNKVKWDTKK